MDNFIVAVNAVIPMFFFVAVGLLIKYKKLMTDLEIKHLNKMLFQIFFFVMLFYNTYTMNVAQTFRPRLITYGACALMVVYVIDFILVCLFEKQPKRRGAMIQAIYRSNFVFMGIPMVTNVYGAEQIGVTTMMIAIIVPMYNVLGVFTLELFRGGKVRPLTVLKNVLTNPMIMGAVIGAICLFSGLKIPAPILKPLGQMSNATSLLALIVLGASFHLSSTSAHLPQLIACVISRLVIVPALVMGIGVLYFGFRGIELMTLVAINCSPSAVASFTMAQQMDSDADLAGNAVVFSTAFSAITICIWIMLFKSCGYI
jgi:predicted permease